MTMAKALGGGLPIGALVTGERLRTSPARRPRLDVRRRPGRRRGGARGARRDRRPRRCSRACASSASGCARAWRSCRAWRGARAGPDGRLRHRRRDAPAIVRRALLEERLVFNATGPETLRFLPPLIVGEAEIDDAIAGWRALLLRASPIPIAAHGPGHRHHPPRPRLRRALHAAAPRAPRDQLRAQPDRPAAAPARADPSPRAPGGGLPRARGHADAAARGRRDDARAGRARSAWRRRSAASSSTAAPTGWSSWPSAARASPRAATAWPSPTGTRPRSSRRSESPWPEDLPPEAA